MIYHVPILLYHYIAMSIPGAVVISVEPGPQVREIGSSVIGQVKPMALEMTLVTS